MEYKAYIFIGDGFVTADPYDFKEAIIRAAETLSDKPGKCISIIVEDDDGSIRTATWNYDKHTRDIVVKDA